MFDLYNTFFLHRPLVTTVTVNGRKGTEVLNPRGILLSNGDTWAEQRPFLFHTLKNFGLGKASMEDTVLEEADTMCDQLKERGKKTILFLPLYTII
jgi:hypothetical protein